MDKQIRDKLIEVIKKQCICCKGNDCDKCCYDGDDCVEERLADAILDSNAIIPENAVVLTREEYETYTFIKRKWGNQDAIKWSELVDGLYEFAREFSKETAEKFAERLKKHYPPRTDKRCTLDDCYMLDKIDEICKDLGGE